jgi:hypothetical protein
MPSLGPFSHISWCPSILQPPSDHQLLQHSPHMVIRSCLHQICRRPQSTSSRPVPASNLELPLALLGGLTSSVSPPCLDPFTPRPLPNSTTHGRGGSRSGMRRATLRSQAVGHAPGGAEREMCPWAISKYFGDWVPTQVLLCWSMQCGGQSANHVKRYVSRLSTLFYGLMCCV